MFGPFHPGDSIRLYRLQRKGVSLDLRQALTQPHSPLREAWLALLTQQAMGQPTYVLFDLQEGEGFVQVRYRPYQAAADVTFLAPTLGEQRRRAGLWARLLDGSCIETASRGIQRVFANLPDAGDEAEVFQQVGFTLYAAEDVFRLAQPRTAVGPGPQPAPRPMRPEDWPAVQKLCVAITPQRVRQAEGGIAVTADWGKNCQRYVLPGTNGDDLLAVLTVCAGGQAHWLRLLIHPDAREPERISVDPGTRSLVEALIHFGLGLLADQPPRAIYCNVRQYESGVRAALEAVGFERLSARTLMVKHTVAWSKATAPELVGALKSSAEIAPPAYHINSEPDLQSPNGRLAAKRDA